MRIFRKNAVVGELEKWLYLVFLLVFASRITTSHAQPIITAQESQFKYVRYDAQSGSLAKFGEGYSHGDDLIQVVFIDSKGTVWVGTNNGLAVYDGKKWSHKTFAPKLGGLERTLFTFLEISKPGVDLIAEGPSGTIWIGASGCGVWQFRNGRYTEISPSPSGIYLDLAVDKSGSPWLVTPESVYKYNGQAWTQVLCPYLAHAVSYKRPKLFRIAIESNGNIWIGGTTHGVPQAPWENTGLIWVVDQAHKARNGGPPIASLYEFNGKGWKAFGPADGLNVKQAIPEIGRFGVLGVHTRDQDGYYVRNGRTWKLVDGDEVSAPKQWILRESRIGNRAGYYSEMFFRDGKILKRVQPIDNKTGELLDLGAEPFDALCIAEDRKRNCVWLGTMHGLYQIWRENGRELKTKR